MAFGGFGNLFAAENAQRAAEQQKHVILLWMSGGPSQFETWDPKPGTPTGGPHLSIPTSVPGLHIDEFMPKLARLSNRVATIRSMATNDNDHSTGSFLAQTGYPASRVIAPPPHWLSMAAHQLPSAKPHLPDFVNINKESDALTSPGPGFLGAKHQWLYCPGNVARDDGRIRPHTGNPWAGAAGAESLVEELVVVVRRLRREGRGCGRRDK
jgi:hypothetical protein